MRRLACFAVASLLFACATSPNDDIATDEAPSNAKDDDAGSQPMPGQGGETPDDPKDEDAGAADAGVDADVDAAIDATTDATTGPENVVIKLVPTRSDWLVAGQPAPFKVNLDAKNCNVFGNACDANVSLVVTIDAPASVPSSTASCSQLQSGTGVRQCSQGAAVTKSATLSPGDDVKVRFHAEAVDDPGANPNCNIDKTWTFTGTGFTLKGETMPATSYWQCIGGGSGQDLDVLLGYKLSL